LAYGQTLPDRLGPVAAQIQRDMSAKRERKLAALAHNRNLVMNSPRLRFLALILGAATASCAAAPQPPAPAMPPPVGDHAGPPPLGFFGATMPFPFADPGPGYDPGGAGLSPRASCLDEIAREAGLRSYIATKLNLTARQQVLWQRLEKAAASGANTRRKACENLSVTALATPPSLPLVMTQEKQLLAARLAELIEVQPALATVYDSLSAEQRAVLDPPFPIKRQSADR
jgi:hypothetical protein